MMKELLLRVFLIFSEDIYVFKLSIFARLKSSIFYRVETEVIQENKLRKEVKSSIE
jgi:hypothetical protein